jgi:VWFA-related protein
MTRKQLLLASAFLLLPCALLLAQQPPTFRGGAVLVTVDAYPQQNGRIVEGLTPSDFDVTEDGKPQTVENLQFVRVEPTLTEESRRDPNTVDEANALAADPRNRVFVVYLDQYHVGFDGSYATQRPLLDTLRRLLTPVDLFGVFTPNMRGSDLTLGRKLDTLENELTRYWPWGQQNSQRRDAEEADLDACFHRKADGSPWMVPYGASVRLLSDLLIQRRREDITLRSLQGLVEELGKLREARSVVLLFTDGWTLFEPDRNLEGQAGGGGRSPIGGLAGGSSAGGTLACNSELSRLSNLDDRARFRDIIAEANRRNVTFYPVSPGGLGVFDSPLSQRGAMDTNPNAGLGDSVLEQDMGRQRDRVQNLKALAENTDGVAVVDTNDMTTGLRHIVDDVSAYYLLGYYSTNTNLDGSYHRIQVKMKRPGLTVKARRGYFAPRGAAPSAATAAAAAATASAAAPVTEALASLSRLRSSADLFIYGIARSDTLMIVGEIPAARIEGGRWTSGADLDAVVVGSKGEAVGTAKARIEPAARGALVTIPRPAGDNGPWRVTVSVTAAGEKLQEAATVTSGGAGSLLGPPIAYRAAPGPRSPIRPIADFQLRRTERAHIEWPILNPLDQREARLLSANAQPLAIAVSLAEPAPDRLTADINLAPLGPGDYVLELIAGAGGKTEKRLLAIRVAQ